MKPEWGTKRVCHKCATHFYDLNKVNFNCPKCESAYTSADFTSKHLKSSEGSVKKETRKKSMPRSLEDQIENIGADLEEEDLIEDTADLDDEDVAEVIKHENESQ